MARTNNATTQNEKILNFLQTGRSLSEKQAVAMFGVNRVSARIAELRASGQPIYTNVNANTGATTYRLGTPSRAMIAAAYEAAGSSVFQ